jgi:hypothetical protein
MTNEQYLDKQSNRTKTIKEKTMNPEAQRIAIAKACGWEKIPLPKDLGCGASAPEKKWYLIHQLPDYINDLNAMAAAESIIIKAGAQTIRLYEDALQKFVANIVFATAAQRAEAFLRTIGK